LFVANPLVLATQLYPTSWNVAVWLNLCKKSTEQVAIAQAVAAGAGIDIGSSSPSPTVLAGVQKTATPTAPPIPTMKQLQLKMQEYHCTTGAEKWLPGSSPFAATGEAAIDETSPSVDPFGEFVACSHAVDVEDEVGNVLAISYWLCAL